MTRALIILRRLALYVVVPAAILFAIGAAMRWYPNPRAHSWAIDEAGVADGSGEVFASIEAFDTNNHGGSARLALHCRGSTIQIEASPVFAECIGDCGSGGLIVQLFQTFEYFVTDPSATTQTGIAAPWSLDGTILRRSFADDAGGAPPAPGTAELLPGDTDAFLEKMAATKELHLGIGDIRMRFDTAGLRDVLPRVRSSCTGS